MPDYELLNPVFEVQNAYDFGDRRTLAIVPYIKINHPCTRGEAIRRLTNHLKEKYQTEKVYFRFWAEGCSNGCGAPQEIS